MTLDELTIPDGLTARERRAAALACALAKEFAPAAAEHDVRGTFPHAHYRRLHETGYLRLAIPRDYGGEGAGLLEMVLAQERLAQGDTATAVAVGMLLNVIGRMGEQRIDELGWPEPLFAKVCETIAREGGLVNSVVTEPALGSISRGGVPAARAERVDGGWRIHGHKIFATGAPALRFLLTAVQLPPSPQAPLGEVARAVIEAPAEGLRFEPTWHDNLSQRSGGSDDVRLDGVFVPDDHLVERTPIGAQTPPAPNGWWLTVAAAYLGAGQAALAEAARYANERRPSALEQRPLAELPHIQQWIGQMHAQLIGARAVLYETARRWAARPEERPALGPRIGAAKYLVTNAVCGITDIGLRVAGGFGLTRQTSLERHFRDARGGLFMPPQDDLALGLLGRTALAAQRHPSIHAEDTP
jgi:alkylation response protein AidB-like acyl-CoA dehydrogenase